MINFLKFTKPLGQTFIPFYVNPLHILAIEDVATENRKGCKIHTTDGQHTFVEESADWVLARIYALFPNPYVHNSTNIQLCTKPQVEGSPPDTGTPPPSFP